MSSMPLIIRHLDVDATLVKHALDGEKYTPLDGNIMDILETQNLEV
jgi:hypothetical protein